MRADSVNFWFGVRQILAWSENGPVDFWFGQKMGPSVFGLGASDFGLVRKWARQLLVLSQNRPDMFFLIKSFLTRNPSYFGLAGFPKV